jgi:hypothetical protein
VPHLDRARLLLLLDHLRQAGELRRQAHYLALVELLLVPLLPLPVLESLLALPPLPGLFHQAALPLVDLVRGQVALQLPLALPDLVAQRRVLDFLGQ